MTDFMHMREERRPTRQSLRPEIPIAVQKHMRPKEMVTVDPDHRDHGVRSVRTRLRFNLKPAIEIAAMCRVLLWPVEAVAGGRSLQPELSIPFSLAFTQKSPCPARKLTGAPGTDRYSSPVSIIVRVRSSGRVDLLEMDPAMQSEDGI